MASVDHRSAAEIEREIDEERSALSRTLDEIQDRLSFESLSNGMFERVRENSGEIGRSVARGVKDHPVPIALAAAAAGLAWILVAQRSSSTGYDPYERVATTPASGRWDNSDRPLDLRDPTAASEPAPLYDDRGQPVRHEGQSRWDRVRGSAADAGRSATGSARSGAHAAGDAMRSGAESCSGGMRRRARSAYASAAELRHRITEGTGDLPQAARKRILTARTRAYEAQLRAEQYAGRGREKASDFFDEQPLVAGALALAVGAAIGGLLPRTNREDEVFGAYRDRVFDEAERIYHEERSKLEKVASETAAEARNVARDVADDVKDSLREGAERTGEVARSKFSEAEDTARDGASRVADTAKTEADRQNLGRPSTDRT